MTTKQLHQLIGAVLTLLAAICAITGGFILFGLGAGLLVMGFVLFFLALMYVNGV